MTNKLFAFLFLSTLSLGASSLTVQNLNTAGDGAYGLFDDAGTLLPDTLTSSIRVGYFDDLSAASIFWQAGDIASLDSSFNQYGSAFGISSGFDGGFQGGPSDVDAQFSGQVVTIWISNSNSFTNESAGAEYLIYMFDSKTFPADNVNGLDDIILGEDAGTFLSGSAGEFGNYSNDFDLGGNVALAGFNTVGIVPEPSTYAALSGLLALTWVMLRRRRG